MGTYTKVLRRAVDAEGTEEGAIVILDGGGEAAGGCVDGLKVAEGLCCVTLGGEAGDADGGDGSGEEEERSEEMHLDGVAC